MVASCHAPTHPPPPSSFPCFCFFPLQLLLPSRPPSLPSPPLLPPPAPPSPTVFYLIGLQGRREQWVSERVNSLKPDLLERLKAAFQRISARSHTTAVRGTGHSDEGTGSAPPAAITTGVGGDRTNKNLDTNEAGAGKTTRAYRVIRRQQRRSNSGDNSTNYSNNSNDGGGDGESPEAAAAAFNAKELLLLQDRGQGRGQTGQITTTIATLSASAGTGRAAGKNNKNKKHSYIEDGGGDVDSSTRLFDAQLVQLFLSSPLPRTTTDTAVAVAAAEAHARAQAAGPLVPVWSTFRQTLLPPMLQNLRQMQVACG